MEPHSDRHGPPLAAAAGKPPNRWRLKAILRCLAAAYSAFHGRIATGVRVGSKNARYAVAMQYSLSAQYHPLIGGGLARIAQYRERKKKSNGR